MTTRETDDLSRIEAHYSKLAREHGDSPEAAQWSNRETQEARMEILLEVGDLKSAKILDFGCGTGHLLSLLSARGFAGQYIGYDLSNDMLAIAKQKFPEARFERRDCPAEHIPERFDYVFVSGVFNNRVTDNWKLMTSLVERLYGATDKALAFNALSSYVDFFDEHLYYADPDAVFRWCKETLSPRVCLRHDYEVKPGVLPFEFTVYVRKAAAHPRPHRAAH